MLVIVLVVIIVVGELSDSEVDGSRQNETRRVNNYCYSYYYSQWRFYEKIFGGPGPSSFGRQQQLSEITIEPIKNLGAGQDLGACAPLAPT